MPKRSRSGATSNDEAITRTRREIAIADMLGTVEEGIADEQ
jgi:hypothetical protein